MCKLNVIDHVLFEGAPAKLDMAVSGGVLTVWINGVKRGTAAVKDVEVWCKEGAYSISIAGEYLEFKPSSFGIDDVRAFFMRL